MSARLNELYWHSRRGMLELDLMLRGFLDAHPDGLTKEQTEVFEELLEYQDQTLLEILMGRQIPMDSRISRIVDDIRAAVAP